MSFKKIFGKIHLWLGFITGPIVFIVGITGAIFVFKEEIETLIGATNVVAIKEQNLPVLPPSTLREICEKENPEYKAIYVSYQSRDRAATLTMADSADWWGDFCINQYTGKIEKKILPGTFNFFDWCIEGHRWLWFSSYEVGHTIVNYATLGFMISLISGLILWWPRNTAGIGQRFRFKWKDTTRWKRKNYDLHNILGFYALIIALIISITGCIIGLEWFSKGVYYLTSGGKSLPETAVVRSDSTKNHIRHSTAMEDQLFHKIAETHPNQPLIIRYFNPAEEETVFAEINETQHYFDRYTLEKIATTNPMFEKIEDNPLALQLYRKNYEIHIGAIGGLPTKILAFFASLIVASLPVTGFMIWRGRRKKKNH